MADLSDILQQQAEKGVQVFRDALRKVRASGRTDQSVRAEVSDKGFKILSREFTDLLESGRRPTKKGPSPEMIERLTEYAQIRGMDKPESAAWGIAKKINKEGDRTFKKGGRDVYTKALDKFVDDTINVIALFQVREARDKIKESVKELK
jgi:hypothetical protein